MKHAVLNSMLRHLRPYRLKASLCLSILCSLSAIHTDTRAQQVPKGLSDTLFSTYYQQRVSLFRLLPSKPGAIIFLGNSITDGGEWSELFPDQPNILNRGISGDMTAGVLNRLDEVTERKPSKVFLLIGTNDLARGISTDSVIDNISLIARLIHKNSPNTRLFIQSIFPVNAHYHLFAGHTSNTEKIKHINQVLQSKADELDYTFIDVFNVLKDKEDHMNIQLSNDGLHLKGPGYMRWKHLIYPYVTGVTQKAALLPAPEIVSYQQGAFPLFKLKTIDYQQDSLKDLALHFRQNTKGLPGSVRVSPTTDTKEPVILIRCVKELDHKGSNFPANQDPRLQEAYHLSVSNNTVTIEAITRHGIFNGLQTLRQLARDGSFIDNCQISDYPKFAWRGYMIDVGRNYQPMDLIKKQIDVMSQLKLNIFHFHLTEDVAWRLATPRYPQLTAAATMTRDPGLFYTENDIKALIEYCRQRFITFIPEIDMPGHSAAFKRAMGFDMQSDSGLIVIKNILEDFTKTYYVPYIHIGADEVQIHKEDFLPTVIQLLQSKGKKIIGWEPGGKYPGNLYRQLWRGTAAVLPAATYKRIDSRNLYINHMAPEESVVSIYNHAIDDQPAGDSLNIGGTLCLWNDRKLSRPVDNLTQNPTLPAMMAFAERSWCGGGKTGNQVGLNHLSQDEMAIFKAFEDRLLAVQKTFYTDIPFAYIRQSNIHFQLLGPFHNQGDLTKAFRPEINLQSTQRLSDNQQAGDLPAAQVRGGTIILRHFWDPTVKGDLDHPTENTTYYAKGRYWSPVDTTALLWLSFYDNSRSTAGAPPAAGTWNTQHAKAWMNGQPIAPPSWTRAGQKGDLEIPYIDENYSFRPPVQVAIKKGWNTLLLKVPVGKFESGLWYQPVKWMFSALFVQPQPGSNVGNMEQNESLYQH